jgi:hypothetical protein
MKRVRRWIYLGIGMAAWKFGRPYLIRRLRRRGSASDAGAP